MTEGTWVSPRVEASATTFALVDRLDEYAHSRGHGLLDLAIAGLASRPGVASVIAGATSPAQIAANAAAGDWRLTAAELEDLPWHDVE